MLKMVTKDGGSACDLYYSPYQHYGEETGRICWNDRWDSGIKHVWTHA